MTTVCLVGKADISLQYELLSRETARNALASYDIQEPFDNSLAVETVSLGAAISLLNDLDWYLVRFVDEALILEPSVTEDEWLSRELATGIRDDRISPEKTGRFLKVYGLVSPSVEDGAPDGGGTPQGAMQNEPRNTQQGKEDNEIVDSPNSRSTNGTPTDQEPDQDNSSANLNDHLRLVEPMLVTRTGDSIPDYDLREVIDTVIVRVTESEFGA